MKQAADTISRLARQTKKKVSSRKRTEVNWRIVGSQRQTADGERRVRPVGTGVFVLLGQKARRTRRARPPPEPVATGHRHRGVILDT